ncbi:ERI1 exoribonuclease 2, partial [Pseudorasbora parva]|uniref:ERI1 exoribonuclease 2 n=1 Tax=Pseudorasbora parva TaxID=51549 RepID=UPI00351DDC9D
VVRELGLIRRRRQSSGAHPCVRKQRFSFLIIIDFESTCWREKNSSGQEIIEFPAVLLNVSSGEIESEFHTFVQPQERPVLSDFCTQLTGITQDQVDSAPPLHICLSRFVRWLLRLQQERGVAFEMDSTASAPSGHPCAFVTWSDWDLGVCLLYECKRKQLRVPEALKSWIDLRATYRLFYNRKPKGLRGALLDLGIQFTGREHSGLVDARNTALLAWQMVCDGCLLTITKSLRRVSVTPPLHDIPANQEPALSADECVPIRSAEECVPIRSAEECVPIRSADECVSGSCDSADECVSIRSADECVPIRSAEECVSIRSADECVPIRSADECVSIRSAEECVPIRSAEECVSIRSADECVSIRSADECVPIRSAEECVPIRSAEECVSIRSADECVSIRSADECVPIRSAEECVPIRSAAECVSGSCDSADECVSIRSADECVSIRSADECVSGSCDSADECVPIRSADECVSGSCDSTDECVPIRSADECVSGSCDSTDECVPIRSADECVSGSCDSTDECVSIRSADDTSTTALAGLSDTTYDPETPESCWTDGVLLTEEVSYDAVPLGAEPVSYDAVHREAEPVAYDAVPLGAEPVSCDVVPLGAEPNENTASISAAVFKTPKPLPRTDPYGPLSRFLGHSSAPFSVYTDPPISKTRPPHSAPFSISTALPISKPLPLHSAPLRVSTNPPTSKPCPPNSAPFSIYTDTPTSKLRPPLSVKRTAPLCGCGRRARRLSVGNGGPNHGRGFYCCPARRHTHQGCQFFQWESALLQQNQYRPAQTWLRALR